MTTNPLYSFLSSSLINEIAKYGGDVSGLVPEQVIPQLHVRLIQRQRAEQGTGHADTCGVPELRYGS